jgi:hypothetical protein
MHDFFLFVLCQYFLYSIIFVILDYFVQIEIIDMIALPLHAALHVTLCLQPHGHHPNAH